MNDANAHMKITREQIVSTYSRGFIMHAAKLAKEVTSAATIIVTRSIIGFGVTGLLLKRSRWLRRQ